MSGAAAKPTTMTGRACSNSTRTIGTYDNIEGGPNLMANLIVGLCNQKGGVGKTSIAVNLAAVFATAGSRVLLVDADPQGSALAWSAAREPAPLFPVVGMPKPTLHRDLPEIARDYDVVVIDGAPRVNELGRAAIMASDLVIIPVQPSPYDVWATQDVVGLVREAQVFKERLRAVFVINRKIVNTAIGRDVGTALAEFGFPIAEVALCQRVIYAESAAQGLSVIEAAPTSEAAREITRFAETIYLRKREAA
jgi:chromosome partitioning protein